MADSYIANGQRAIRRVATASNVSGGAPRTHDELDLAVQNVQKSNELTEALPRVGRIKKPVQLRHGGTEATRQLSATQARLIHASPGFNGELVNQELGEIGRILVVLECVFDV